MFSRKTIVYDLLAGISVAFIAIPLSLAIALASGVSPGTGLITAIIAGIVCALFGGTPLAVSGPAAAMAILVADTVERFGAQGLLVIGLIAGGLQLLTGVLGFGKFARLIPTPVISGFTAGIGAIILIGQLPRVLGLPAPDQSHVWSVISHLSELIHQTNFYSLGIAGVTLFLTFYLPKKHPFLPGALIGIVGVTLGTIFLNLPVQVLGEIPSSLPLPKLPSFPSSNWGDYFITAVIIYSVASIESLLSSAAVDKLSKKDRHDPNREMIGQGLGNIASAFFGGIPVTSVIARSGLNVQAGAKTRLSSIIHSIVLIISVYFFSKAIGQIPIAALAGVLLAISFKMLNPIHFKTIWKSSRLEGSVFLITFLAIVCFDLLFGIKAGIFATLGIVLVKHMSTRIRAYMDYDQKLHRFSLRGPVTFLSLGQFDRLQEKVLALPHDHAIILDSKAIQGFDHSGAEAFIETLQLWIQNKRKLAVTGLSRIHLRKLSKYDTENVLERVVARSEADVPALLNISIDDYISNRLRSGFVQFKREVSKNYVPLFEKLSSMQTPHTLFLTCADSRIIPHLFVLSEPGELFTIRNVGNIIPAPDQSKSAEGAAIEYATEVLGVKRMIICGHSNCGAMRALVSRQNLEEYPHLKHWLNEHTQLHLEKPSEDQLQGVIDEAAKQNAIFQFKQIQKYPSVKKRLDDGSVQIHVWFYEISKGRVLEWSSEKNEFIPVVSRSDSQDERQAS